MTWRAHDDYEKMRARLTEIEVERDRIRPWMQFWAGAYDALFWAAVFFVCMVVAALASNGAIDLVPWAVSVPGIYAARVCVGQLFVSRARLYEALAAEERFWLFEQGRWWRGASRRAIARHRAERGGGEAA